MHYELWHMPSGNLVNTFESQRDALDFVRLTYEQQGRERAEELALGTEDRRGGSTQIAIGSELLARALGEVPGRAVGTP